MPYCNNCGTQVSENAKFCENCGKSINAQYYTQPQHTQQYPQYQYVQYVRPKVPGRGYGISSMILGIIGLLYAFYFVLGTFALMFALRDSGGARGALLITMLIFSSLSIMATAFSIAAKNRGYINGISASGSIMGVIGLIIYSVVAIMIICLAPLT